MKQKKVSRKLKTTKIDGKTIICKSYLDNYYIEKQFTKTRIQELFGIGHRILDQSLRYWYTAKELKLAASNNYRNAQLRCNSNKVNWFKPRKILDKQVILSELSKCSTKREVMYKLGVSKYELSHNMQYHDISISKKKNKYHEKLTNKDLELLSMLTIYDINLSNLYNIDETFIDAIHSMESIYIRLSNIRRKIYSSNRGTIIKFKSRIQKCSNQTEYAILKELKKRYKHIETQVQLGKYFYDFAIGKTLLEVDGHLHKKDIDNLKDLVARKNGYEIVRLKLKTEKYKITYKVLHSRKKLKECLEKLLYPKLDPLVEKQYMI